MRIFADRVEIRKKDKKATKIQNVLLRMVVIYIRGNLYKSLIIYIR